MYTGCSLAAIDCERLDRDIQRRRTNSVDIKRGCAYLREYMHTYKPLIPYIICIYRNISYMFWFIFVDKLNSPVSAASLQRSPRRTSRNELEKILVVT